MPVEAEPTDQDLETAIENAYQEMNPENPVFVINQKISNGEHHSCNTRFQTTLWKMDACISTTSSSCQTRSLYAIGYFRNPMISL